jgi:hypothetical protein
MMAASREAMLLGFSLGILVLFFGGMLIQFVNFVRRMLG